jgi:hypothetical protein
VLLQLPTLVQQHCRLQHLVAIAHPALQLAPDRDLDSVHVQDRSGSNSPVKKEAKRHSKTSSTSQRMAFYRDNVAFLSTFNGA